MELDGRFGFVLKLQKRKAVDAVDRIIDMHAHIWRNRAEACAKSMHQAAERFGIEKILVSALGSHYPDKAEVTELNELTENLIRQDSLFSGYVTVSPEHDNSLDVLRKGIEKQGMIGMKIWVSCLCDDACCDKLYDYCGGNNVPVLIHAFAKSSGQLPAEATAVHVADAARRHPGTKFIMAHLGGNSYHGIRMIRDLPNVWTDFSGGPFRCDDIPYVIDLLGAERILFGTDNAYAMNYGQVLEAQLPKEQKEQILFRNAAVLFGL